MQIIPVLDISEGLIVHAKKGERKNYLPIASRLCASSTPFDIIESMLNLYAFRRIYIADLDALQQQNDNIDTIGSICQKYPELEIWLDTGLSLANHYLENLEFTSLRIVLSTESINSISTFTSFVNRYAHHNFIFSIDYKSGTVLGSYELLQAREQWPTDILILNLDHVGTGKGISIPAQLSHSLFQKHNAYYGGGIRNCNDLHKLKVMGATGALLSTALHSKAITRSELISING